MIQAIATLCLVLGLLIATLFALRFLLDRIKYPSFLKRLRASSPLQGQMHIEETIMLDTKRRMVRMRYLNKDYLIVLGPQGERLIDTLLLDSSVSDARAADQLLKGPSLMVHPSKAQNS